MKITPSDGSYSTFCDIVTGYRLTTAILQAVKTGVIAAVGAAGCSEAELLAKTGLQAAEGGRFLALLLRVGVLEIYDECFYLSQFSRKYLHGESDLNQLHVLEFEQGLMERWNGLGNVLQTGQGAGVSPQPDADYEQRLELFQQAMHEAAIVRAHELWSALPALPETGLIIDIGAGDGTYLREFLRRYPRWRGVAVDLAEVVARIKDDRITAHACNLLEAAELDGLVAAHRNSATVILLSNVIHCYSEAENSAILGRLQDLVVRDGVVVLHDFFTDGNGFGALYDLHMMVNTYNGRGYSFAAARRMLAEAGFGHAELLELPSYSHTLVASRQPGEARADLTLLLRHEAFALGFFAAVVVDPAVIAIEPWVTAKCQYGCAYYGRKWSCPPHSPGGDEFRALLGCYTRAVLVVGQPPLAGFQNSLLELEKAAFLHGFKKALVFSGGPCSWCTECAADRCRFPEKRRPSLEACGCDVFALAEACNVRLEPLKNRDDFVQYVGLLLVE